MLTLDERKAAHATAGDIAEACMTLGLMALIDVHEAQVPVPGKIDAALEQIERGDKLRALCQRIGDSLGSRAL